MRQSRSFLAFLTIGCVGFAPLLPIACGGSSSGGGSTNDGGADVTSQMDAPASVDHYVAPMDAAEDTFEGPEGATDAVADVATADVVADAVADVATADVVTDAPADVASPCNGAMTCTVSSTCPTAKSDCVTATCSAMCCGTANLPAEQKCATNKGTVCDGNGTCVACVQKSDCPATGTVCLTTTACTGNACVTTPAATGTDCLADAMFPAHVCGNTSTSLAGKCVQCNVNADCMALDDGGIGTCNTATGTCTL